VRRGEGGAALCGFTPKTEKFNGGDSVLRLHSKDRKNSTAVRERSTATREQKNGRAGETAPRDDLVDASGALSLKSSSRGSCFGYTAEVETKEGRQRR
jgi:hypothetical protein